MSIREFKCSRQDDKFRDIRYILGQNLEEGITEEHLSCQGPEKWSEGLAAYQCGPGELRTGVRGIAYEFKARSNF